MPTRSENAGQKESHKKRGLRPSLLVSCLSTLLSLRQRRTSHERTHLAYLKSYICMGMTQAILGMT